MEYAEMVEVIPEGESGVTVIRHAEVSQQHSDMTRIRAAINDRKRDYIPAGRYVQLFIGGQLYMSDTPTEQRENQELLNRAKGDVLIAGLGIGMVLVPLLANPAVTSVTVVEMNPDVVALVAPYFPEVNVVTADFLEWSALPGVRWDTIYFDIWPTIDVDDMPEVAKLRKRYRRRLSPGGWMGSWAHDLRRKQRRVEVAMVHEQGYTAADIPLGENPVDGLKAADARKGRRRLPNGCDRPNEFVECDPGDMALTLFAMAKRIAEFDPED